MPDMPSSTNNQINAIRSFNRFYTRQIGLLEEGLLKSEFSLTEVRILYELAHSDGLTATGLGRDLGLDAGYLSRLLKKFEKRDFLIRRPSADDARQSVLALTTLGREAFSPLNQSSHDEVAALLDRLVTNEREKLVKAMGTIQMLLGGLPDDKVSYILRMHQPGDIGWITHRQAVLYHQEYGWDETYEALIAEIMSTFIKEFDSRYERAWIAERLGEIVGSVFVVRKSEEVAKLRLLYVEPSARGLGIGKRLVDECIQFARGKGYKTLTLWTNDILVSARRIYEATGFKLIEEEHHRSFGKDLVGQDWTLDL
ncbi:MAG: bifunctional helix-turn-helix transcriptional regulator/GNAT family N-acetyltransferase [Geminicoccaceae bacterium]